MGHSTKMSAVARAICRPVLFTFFPYFYRRISPMPNTPFPWPVESAPAYTLFPRTWLRSNTKWSWPSSRASCPKITCQIWTPRKRPLRPLMGIRQPLPRRRHRRTSRRLRTCITKRPIRRKHSVKIGEFSYFLDFTWNQYWWI